MSWSIIERQRRRLAVEAGAVVKDWGGRIPVAIAFPNTYHAGMSNLGLQSLYGLMNDQPDVVCERVFLPEKDLMEEYARTNTPLLSLETQRPLAEFELIAFSLSYEGDYPNLLRMLDLARIPTRRDLRSDPDPLVLAGGVSMRTNPEPLALFLDLILMGDGEVIIAPLLEAWREARSNPLPRSDRALCLAKTVPGAYAPEFYRPVEADGGGLLSLEPIHPDLPEKISPARALELPRPALATRVLSPETEFSSTRLVEISRGCGRSCRFCLASFVNRPPRVQPLESVLEALGEPDGGRVGLVSPAVADHPQLEEMIRALIDQGREVTVSSLRVEALTPGLMQALSGGKLKGVAIAPEAGSERLRCAINKGLTEEMILDGAALLANAGLRSLKLYFILGLPYETDQDVSELIDLVLKIQKKIRSAALKGTPGLTVTVSHFSPKPFTPFEARPMDSLKRLRDKTVKVQKALNRAKGIRVHADPPKWTYLQTLFSRGSRSVGDVIEAMAKGAGPAEALKKAAVNPDDFVLRDMAEDRAYPWSFIDHGLSEGFLAREDKRAADGKLTPACKPDVCRLCGVCPPGKEAVH